MFVFGINLPVAEILFVLLVLYVLAMVFIIVQIVKLGRHVRILDETTLEIRRYEETEEVTLRMLETHGKLSAAEKRRFNAFRAAAVKLQERAAAKLAGGEAPAQIKQAFIAKGVPEHVATRAVNSAGYWLDRRTSDKSVLDAMKAAAKK